MSSSGGSPFSAQPEMIIPEEMPGTVSPASSSHHHHHNQQQSKATTTTTPPPPRKTPRNGLADDLAGTSFASRQFAQQHRYRPNLTADALPPAAMCLARKADPAPYTPITAEGIQVHVQLLDYSLRPQPFASQQAVADFYRACHGRYGVSVNFDPAVLTGGARTDSGSNSGHNSSGGGGGGASSTGWMAAASTYVPITEFELRTLGSHAHGGKGLSARGKRSRAATAGGGGGGGGVSGPLPSSSLVSPVSSSPSAAKTTAAAAAAVMASGGVDESSSLRDHRLAQLHRNVKHTDTSLCMYYNTKEGCRRGEQCDFQHLKM